MIVHGNAKLGPAGRFALTQAIADGMTQKVAAAAFCVSPAGAPVVASTSGRERRGSPIGRLDVGSLQPPTSKPAAA